MSTAPLRTGPSLVRGEDFEVEQPTPVEAALAEAALEEGEEREGVEQEGADDSEPSAAAARLEKLMQDIEAGVGALSREEKLAAALRLQPILSVLKFSEPIERGEECLSRRAKPRDTRVHLTKEGQSFIDSYANDFFARWPKYANEKTQPTQAEQALPSTSSRATCSRPRSRARRS